MIPVAADAEQALAMIRSHPDGTVVDVRDEEEYITGHLADAVLLPVDEISAETAAEALPDQSSPVLVYCKTGKRSRAAAEKLAALGYSELYDLGIQSLKRQEHYRKVGRVRRTDIFIVNILRTFLYRHNKRL